MLLCAGASVKEGVEDRDRLLRLELERSEGPTDRLVFSIATGSAAEVVGRSDDRASCIRAGIDSSRVEI